MDHVNSITNDNSVFNRQPSIYNGSTTNSNFNEALIVVWFRTNSAASNVDLESIENKIENSADFLKNYYSAEECKKYVVSSGKNIKIFLILPQDYPQGFLESLHDLPVLESIYVNGEIDKNEDLNRYQKIVKTDTDIVKLTDELCSEVYNYIQHIQLPMTIFKQQYQQDQSTNVLNKFAYFVEFWNPLFIDLLFDLPQTDYDQQKYKFLEQCRIYYRANEAMLKSIDEFKDTYKPEFAIQWYQGNGFVYRLLNKVMRQQNIEGILMFRFFILDLCNALKKIYHEFIRSRLYEDDESITVYRGQKMFINELGILNETFKQGSFIISINSFFSASRTKNVALTFSGVIGSNKKSLDLQPVLFEIEVEINQKMQGQRKPFSDICHLSTGPKKDEIEVIFMVDSFFRIDKIIENHEIETSFEGKQVKVVVTLIKLTFINEDDVNIPIMQDYQILKSTKTIEGKLIRIGNLLIDQSLSCGSSRSKADAYYRTFLNEPKFLMTAACLAGQAWMALKQEQYDSAIKLALEAFSIVDASNVEVKITILNCLGGIYSKLKQYPTALKYYKEAYNLSKPTDDKIAANSYSGPCVPIDKFAMYDNYRNISSINIARIYQINGDTQQAWNVYKEAIDCEMRDTTDFHCHTCMTIAESGTHEKISNPKEKIRAWENEKKFLDLGLDDILKYRSSALTGYLSLNYQYDFSSRRYNNNYCRTLAINYFRKVEKQCLPYAANQDYYLYTLQCYERLPELYRDRGNQTIDYYEKMIQLCLKYHPDDLENIIIGYQGMRESYTRQQSRSPEEYEDILTKLCADDNDPIVTPLITPPITPWKPPVFGKLFQNINHLHFAFDYYDKWIDSRLNNESDLRKRIIYCNMKLAALYYDHNKVNDAKDCLTKTILLCQPLGTDAHDIRCICNENLSFICMNFDVTIESYKNRLTAIKNIAGECTGENNYCYIAHLYEKKNDFNLALEFFRKPIEYFEQYDYICSHTIECYSKLAKHYQIIQNDKESTADTYQRAIHLVDQHRSYPMTTIISIVEQNLINYFKNINDLDTTILIYERLCETVQHETSDITVLYKHLKQILKLLVDKHDALAAVVDTYENFLNLTLQIISPLTSQMTMVLSHFRDQFIAECKKRHCLRLVIQIYQKLILLLFQHQYDTMKIIDEYEIIAAKLNVKHLLEDAVIGYENLLEFVCLHHTTGYFIEDDKIAFVFCIWKDEIIKKYLSEDKFDSAINLHYKMIRFLEQYRLNINTEYDFREFTQRILQNYDDIAIIYQMKKNDFDQTMNIYQEQIEFMAKYQLGTIQSFINTIILNCQQFAAAHQEQALEVYLKLANFIQKNRLEYLSHLSLACQEFNRLKLVSDKNQQYLDSSDDVTNGNDLPNSWRIVDLKQRVFDYKEKTNYYFNNNELDKAIKVYRTELLPFLLENHGRDDEQMATCYKQIATLYYGENEKDARMALNYYQKAIDIYETQEDNFYTEHVFELNTNICRRYAGILFTCYNFMKTIFILLNDENSSKICQQKGIDIYEKHKDQFQFYGNLLTNTVTVEIRPFVELNY
ncbi:unnamed protein product [Rotaria socialis]|uniref:Uncharacterized protein n=1 Tax=Rotaria socialis TaxID=392032 RepID=A0A817S5R5_9BILA|nr:unnamed protein product [Rotaria socialis]CAF4156014.1 unnamed protein product [Rotaria socialis]